MRLRTTRRCPAEEACQALAGVLQGRPMRRFGTRAPLPTAEEIVEFFRVDE